MKFSRHERGNALVLLVVMLLLMIGLGGGGFWIYQQKLQKAQGPAKEDLPDVHLTLEVIRFSFTTLPELYKKMAEIQRELNLIHMETARLDALFSEYPQQKKMIHDEKAVWEKTLKNLLAVLRRFETQIETIFVAYAINPEKGRELIDNSTPDLLTAATEAIAASRIETARIRIEPPKTFMEKLKAKFAK